MNLQKLIIAASIIGSTVLLTGCQQRPDPYARSQICLAQVIEQCKQHGWKYMRTHNDCQRASVEGVYGLSPTQRMACCCAEQAAKTHR
jgi:hypothetical protein